MRRGFSWVPILVLGLAAGYGSEGGAVGLPWWFRNVRLGRLGR